MALNPHLVRKLAETNVHNLLRDGDACV